MTQNRAEAAADEIIAREAASARGGRVNKDRPGRVSQSTMETTTWTTTPTARSLVEAPPLADEPKRTSPPYLAIAGGLLLAVVVAIVGFIALNSRGGQTATATPTPTPAGSTAPTTTAGQQATPTPTPTTQAGATPSPAPTSTTPAEVTSIDDYFSLLGVDDQGRTELVAATATDPPGDWVEPDPQLDPAQADIVAVIQFEIALGPGAIAKLPACGGLCAGGAAPPKPGEYYGYAIQARGPVAGAENAFLELGIAFLDKSPTGGGKAEALDQGPNSFLTGTNAAYSARFAAPSSGFEPVLFRLSHTAGRPFLDQDDSTAFALVRGNVIGVFVPEEEFSGVMATRLYAYFQQTQPLFAVSDTWPDMTSPMSPYNPATTVRIVAP
jgi:hypothetical protein